MLFYNHTFQEGDHDGRGKTDDVMLFYNDEWMMLITERFSSIAICMLLLQSILTKYRITPQYLESASDQVVTKERALHIAEWLYSTGTQAIQCKIKQRSCLCRSRIYLSAKI
jgi:hypothetical protein